MAILSKTRYLQHLQCPKLLWLSLHSPELLPQPSPADKHRMSQGREVEDLARRLFDGTLIEHDDSLNTVIEESVHALDQCETGDCVFRSVIKAGDLVAEMDILRLNLEGRYDIYEVKSGTGIKAEYMPDVAFQTHVFQQAGYPFGETALITVNTDYVRHGSISPHEMFTITDVTADVLEMLPTVAASVNEAQKVMAQPECPEVPIGPHCSGCPLMGTADGCWAHVHAEPCNVFSLYRLQANRAFGWYEQGFLRSADIPNDYPLSDKQRIQIAAEQTGEPHVNGTELRRFINSLEFPLFFLDFETVATAIPLLDKTSPYQAIPFQFSLHILRHSLDGEPQHISWIWDGDMQEDPREEMLHCLKHLLEDRGSIVAYNAAFEKTVLRKCVGQYPQHADWLKGLLPRFVDLLVPFRSFFLYHPTQHGSCSMKTVLPVWTGKGYEGLQIHDGEQAGREYLRVITGEVDDAERQRVWTNLEKYCGLDTEGMIDLLRVLQEKIG